MLGPFYVSRMSCHHTGSTSAPAIIQAPQIIRPHANCAPRTESCHTISRHHNHNLTPQTPTPPAILYLYRNAAVSVSDRNSIACAAAECTPGMQALLPLPPGGWHSSQLWPLCQAPAQMPRQGVAIAQATLLCVFSVDPDAPVAPPPRTATPMTTVAMGAVQPEVLQSTLPQFLLVLQDAARAASRVS